jgi:hypothetical protein
LITYSEANRPSRRDRDRNAARSTAEKPAHPITSELGSGTTAIVPLTWTKKGVPELSDQGGVGKKVDIDATFGSDPGPIFEDESVNCQSTKPLPSSELALNTNQ